MMPRAARRHQPHSIIRHLFAFAIGALCTIAVGCTSATGPGLRVLTLEVFEQRVSCVSEGQHECLRVREQRPDASWELFYGDIEGFAYEPSFRYVLRVAVSQVKNPPADGSSLRYRLVRVVSKVAAA